MAKCPNCNEGISEKLSKEGGTCPRCAQVILSLGDDFDLEPSDTQEQALSTSSKFETTEPVMIPFSDTDEYEATELIRPLPKRGKGSVADLDYQEDFPDEDFIEEEDCIVVDEENVAPPPKNNILSVILILTGIVGIVGGYLFSDKKNASNGEGLIRHEVSYSNGYSEEQEQKALQEEKEKKEREEAERKAKEEEEKRARRARILSAEAESNDIDPKIEKVLDLRMGTFHQCIDYALMKQPDFHATIRYKLTIEADGSVTNPSITVKGDKPPKFESCLNKAIKKWRFPKTAESIKINRTLDTD